jgi:hypothetical protein
MPGSVQRLLFAVTHAMHRYEGTETKGRNEAGARPLFAERLSGPTRPDLQIRSLGNSCVAFRQRPDTGSRHLSRLATHKRRQKPRHSISPVDRRTTRATSLDHSRTDCLAHRSAVCDPRSASNRCVHFRRWRPFSAGWWRARADRRRTDPNHLA